MRGARRWAAVLALAVASYAGVAGAQTQAAPGPAWQLDPDGDDTPSPETAAFVATFSTVIPMALGGAINGAAVSDDDGDSAGFVVALAGVPTITIGAVLGPSIGHFYAGEPATGGARAGIRMGLYTASAAGVGAAVALLGDSDSQGAGWAVLNPAGTAGSAGIGMTSWDLIDSALAAERTERRERAQRDYLRRMRRLERAWRTTPPPYPLETPAGAHRTCRNALACRDEGACSFLLQRFHPEGTVLGPGCGAAHNQDCSRSRACEQEGRCLAFASQCVRRRSQEPPEPPAGKPRSIGMRNGGIALLAIGGTLTTLGSVLLTGSEDAGAVAGAFLMPTGGTLTAIGVPLLGIGASEIPEGYEANSVGGAAFGTVMTALGVTGIGLASAFWSAGTDAVGIGAVPASIGAVCLAIGVPVAVNGAREVPMSFASTEEGRERRWRQSPP